MAHLIVSVSCGKEISMSNKVPPKPTVCEVCEEEFYGRSDAKTCSNKCRKKKQYHKDKKK